MVATRHSTSTRVAGALRASLDQGAQFGETARIADAGHVGGQETDGVGRGEPAQRRTNHVGADQDSQRAAEVEVGLFGQTDPVGADPIHHHRPPRRRAGRGFCTAGVPALLPAVTRLVGEPVQRPAQPAASLSLGVGLVGKKRGGEKQLQHLFTGLPGRRPNRWSGARREPDQQLRDLFGRAAGPVRSCDGRRRRVEVAVASLERVHARSRRNKMSKDSGRYRNDRTDSSCAPR